MKNSALLCLVMGLWCASWPALPARADGGTAMIQPHLLAIYPAADPESPSDRTPLLSKDPVAKIRKYYEGKLQAGDKLEAFQEEETQGFRLIFYQTIEGGQQSLQLLEAAEQTPKTLMHSALGELKGLVMKGLHSEDEYQAMEKQYRSLAAAYYRRVDDGEGGTVDEGERIYRQAREKAHGGEEFEVDQDEMAAGKAQAKELKKKMKALKAKGDIAGMMKLAQQSQMAPPTVAGEAMQAMAKDTWDIWAACLRDLKAAAYWTRLEFNYGALPAGE